MTNRRVAFFTCSTSHSTPFTVTKVACNFGLVLSITCTLYCSSIFTIYMELGSIVFDMIGNSKPKTTGVFCWKTIALKTSYRYQKGNTYSDATSSHLYALDIAGYWDLVAFLAGIWSVRVRKVDVALRLLHDALDTQSTLSYDVGMVCVAYIHFHGNPVTL